MYDIKFKQGDITKSDCECIVNAANSSLLGGGGVDGAIHRAAGGGLLQECKTLGGCATGCAKITKGYNLKAKWVIHTVGPIYGDADEDATLLSLCYRNSLDLARANSIRSISFPAISTGAYGYPVRAATVVALSTVMDWLDENKDYEITIEFCVFDEYTHACYLGVYDALVKSREQRTNEFVQAENAKIVSCVEMHLADEPFELIKSGEKTVEVRLYDEKRRAIKAGDTIIFFRGKYHDAFVVAKVVGLHRFDGFSDLFESYLFDKTGSGNLSPSEAAEKMYRYYSPAQEREYGVLGIEIELKNVRRSL